MKKKQRTIGIDLGHKNLVTLSNGVSIKEHKSLNRLRFNLNKLQRQVLRQAEGSKRRQETIRVIERTKQRIEQAEQDHANKLAKFLVGSYRVICIEGKGTNDSYNRNWEIVRKTLRKKSKETNRVYIEVAPYLTTQTCSKCGIVKKIPKERRVYECDNCGLILDRDINAAINIRRKGLNKLS